MYKKLREGRLAMFMTYGMSLRKWDEAGILSRELKPYIEMAKELELIYIVTYGSWTEERKYQEQLPTNIILLCNNTIFPSALYSLFAPWIHAGFLKGVDYFKTNQMASGYTALIAKKLFGSKLIVRQGYPWLKTLEEKKAAFWKRILAGLTEKLAYSAADVIIVTSDRDKSNIEADYGVPKEKIYIIPNYIDTDLFNPDPSLRRNNRLLYVGRLEPEKNLIRLIKAVKGLEAVELTIIGDGSMRRQLEAQAKDEGNTNVRFLGRVPNESLPHEYNRAALYIQPSLYEGNPKTILEAMACGCIVIGSNVRGVRDVITHKKNGFLCGADEYYIRGTIMGAHYFMTNFGKAAGEMREKARATIVNDYSLQSIVKKELELCQSPLPSGRGMSREGYGQQVDKEA